MNHRTIFHKMQTEYKHTAVPKSLETRVKTVICLAESEKKRKREKRSWMAAAGAIAAAALFTLIVNMNQVAAQAMEKIPVVGMLVKVVTAENYKSSEVGGNYEAKVEIPQIHIDSDGNIDYNAAESNVNQEIREYVNAIISDYEKELEESKGVGYKHVESSYQVEADGDRLFSIRINTVLVMAGTDSFSQIYHIDKKTGKQVILSDLFEKDSNYVEILSEEIKRQMVEQMAEDKQVSYFFNTEYEGLNFSQIKENQNFYINEAGKLVLVFDKYEIAPGYMGMVEFVIPSEVLSGIVVEGYVKF